MADQGTIPSFIPWSWPSDSAASFPMLTGDEVHIWRSPLDVPPALRTQLQAYLSEDEQARAFRFRFDHHRHHFIAGRGLLRVLLGRYIQQTPQDLVFGYGDRGKPFLANTTTSPQDASIASAPQVTTVEFNVSHSGGMALYAIALNRRVGIDLEAIRPMPQAAQLAQRFFTDNEYAQLLAQPPSQQEQAFFRGWTRKEAYLKATGEGLAGLENVEVSLLPHQPSILHGPTFHATEQQHPGSSNGTNDAPSPTTVHWCIQDIPLDTHHMAAVVYETKEMASSQNAIRFFQMEFRF